MTRLLAMVLIAALVAPALGCRSSAFQGMFDGVNSDERRGGDPARMPQPDGDGGWHAPAPDWGEGPRWRLW